MELGPLARRVVALEERLAVAMSPGPDVTLNADPDQLEQLLINVLRNAVDAALETGGNVTAGWAILEHALEVWIDDEGPGLQNTGNLNALNGMSKSIKNADEVLKIIQAQKTDCFSKICLVL